MGEGDSTVSVFDSAPQAIEAALAATRALAAESWPGDLRIVARFGLHTGEAERRGTDYFGPTINLAARLRGQADGGQIFLSSVTADLVARRLPAGCELVDLGPHRLKGSATPERIHAVQGPGVERAAPVTECPYRGLLAFEPEDREFFFGREEVVEDLLGRLAPRPARGRGRRIGKRQVLGAARRPHRRGRCGRGRRDRARPPAHPGSRPRLDIADDPRPSSSSSTSSRSCSRCATTRTSGEAFIDALLALPRPGGDRQCAPTSTAS